MFAKWAMCKHNVTFILESKCPPKQPKFVEEDTDFGDASIFNKMYFLKNLWISDMKCHAFPCHIHWS
jgi:hypothetical protein